MTEAPRDQLESAFTPILRQLYSVDPCVLAVIFVDTVGECIDYCSTLPPYEAKVIAAHLISVVADSVDRFHETMLSRPYLWEIKAMQRDLIVRRITDDYMLVVVAKAHRSSLLLDRAIDNASSDLRYELGSHKPSWDPTVGIEVRTQSSRHGSSIPVWFQEHKTRAWVDSVLGFTTHLTSDSGAPLIYYRIRTKAGEELSLVYDVRAHSWSVER